MLLSSLNSCSVNGVVFLKAVQVQHRRRLTSFDHAYMRVGTRTDLLKVANGKIFQSPLEEFFKTFDKRCIAFLPAHSGLLQVCIA